MHLQQHNLCTRKTEFALEVKFYGDECWPTEVTSNTYFRGVGFDPKNSKGRELPKCLKWVCSTTVVGAKGFVYLMFGSVCVCICVFIWREIPIFSSQGPLWYLSGRRSCWAGSVGIGTYKAISVETCKCATTSQNMCFWSILHCRTPTWEKELLERRTFFFIRIDYQTFTHISVAGCLWSTTWSGSLLGSLRLSYWSVWHL